MTIINLKIKGLELTFNPEKDKPSITTGRKWTIQGKEYSLNQILKGALANADNVAPSILKRQIEELAHLRAEGYQYKIPKGMLNPFKIIFVSVKHFASYLPFLYYLNKLKSKQAEIEKIVSQNEYAAIEKYGEKDSVEIIKSIKAAAAKGDKSRQFLLARMYQNGMGVKKDTLSAMVLYEKAALQGHTEAQGKLKEWIDGQGPFSKEEQFFISELYEKGQCVDKDPRKMIMWRTRAATQNHPLAKELLKKLNASTNKDDQFFLGTLSEEPVLVDDKKPEPNIPKAMDWYLKAAMQGHKEAQNKLNKWIKNTLDDLEKTPGDQLWHLSKLYESGEWVGSKNPILAMKLLSLAAKANEPNAIAKYKQIQLDAEKGGYQAEFSLAQLLESTGDVKESIIWYRKAALQGHPKSQYKIKEWAKSNNMPADQKWLLSQFYRQGIQGCIEINIEEAMRLLKEAADGGLADAQFDLAVRYDQGDLLRKNTSLAINYFHQAALQKHFDAETQLSFLVQDCIEKTEKGDIDAQVLLGELYEKGITVEKNIITALRYYEKSANQNQIFAQFKINRWIASAENHLETLSPNENLLLGQFYLRGVKGCTERNLEMAKTHILKAANDNLPEAQYELGRILEGENKQKDAFECYKKAAKQGYLDAHFAIGVLSENLDDSSQAFEAYFYAASLGQKDAIVKLGRCYENGVGTESDLYEAAFWYNKAISKNAPDAEKRISFLLGKLKILIDSSSKEDQLIAFETFAKVYENGVIVPKDLKKAAEFYNAAAKLSSFLICTHHDFFDKNGELTKQTKQTLELYSKAEELGIKGAKESFFGDIRRQDALNYRIKNYASTCLLARLYEEGYGVQQNKEKAYYLYTTAAFKGWNPEALYQLGIKLHGKVTGEEVRLKLILDKSGREKAGLTLINDRKVDLNLSEWKMHYLEEAKKGGHPLAQKAQDELLSTLRDTNSQDSFRILGKFYEIGLGVKKDINLAIENYLKAKDKTALTLLDKYYQDALNGDAEAAFIMAQFYEKGNPLEPNLKEAAQYYQIAASKNHPKALSCLGHLYLEGKGVERNIPMAYLNFDRLAKTKDDQAIQIKNNILKTFMDKALEAMPEDLYDLSYIFYIEKNYKDAITSCELAIKKGFPKAHELLGDIYQAQQKTYKALECYDVAISEGSLTVQDKLEKMQKQILTSREMDTRPLGYLYEKGLGVKKDLVKAMSYYTDDMCKQLYSQIVSDDENNVPEAAFNLGRLYFEGNFIPRDTIKAFKQFEKAAEKGHIGAMLELASCYEKAVGTKQDLTSATIWREMALKETKIPNTEKKLATPTLNPEKKPSNPLKDLIVYFSSETKPLDTASKEAPTINEGKQEEDPEATKEIKLEEVEIEDLEAKPITTPSFENVENLVELLTENATKPQVGMELEEIDLDETKKVEIPLTSPSQMILSEDLKSNYDKLSENEQALYFEIYKATKDFGTNQRGLAAHALTRLLKGRLVDFKITGDIWTLNLKKGRALKSIKLELPDNAPGVLKTLLNGENIFSLIIPDKMIIKVTKDGPFMITEGSPEVCKTTSVTVFGYKKEGPDIYLAALKGIEPINNSFRIFANIKALGDKKPKISEDDILEGIKEHLSEDLKWA